MSPHKNLWMLLAFLSTPAYGLTLEVGQEHFTTTENITTLDADGIQSSLSGSNGALNSLTNNHIITTGDAGASSGDYAINITGDYYNITNNNSLQTTGNSGRGISLRDFSEVLNAGSITTQGTTSYGIYALGDQNTITNAGSITTSGTTSYGVYLKGDTNMLTNSGTINTNVYGIYATGSDNNITNSGTITTSESSSAHGIFVSVTGGEGTNITNASSGIINSVSHGIYAKDNTVTITNNGTINSSSNASDYAINNEGDNAVITNGATGILNATTYGIQNTGANVTITNYGTINAGIYIGSGTLNLLSGSISGNIDGEENTGTINIGSNSITATINQTAGFNNVDALTILNGSTLNSYSDINATTITLADSGTLTLHDGFSLRGAIQGANSASGTLNISGTSFSPSSQIGASNQKIANLTILNDGALTASRDMYVSNLFINHGSLHLNSANNLTIFGNLVGGGQGTINLGTKSHTINGNLTLSAGDTLITQLGHDTGHLTITGAANIDTNASLTITTATNQTFVDSGTTYTLLTANSGSINAISDANITIDGVSSNTNGLLTYTTNALDNSLTLTVTRLQAQQATSNKNAQNIYRTLYAIGGHATDALSSFQTYLDNTNLSPALITDNLTQLSPQSTKALLATNINVINNSFRTIDTRLDTVRHTTSKAATNGLWMEAFTSIANQDAIADDDGYDSNATGFILGADTKLDNDNQLGLALGYIKSNITSLDNLRKSIANSYQLNLYHSWNMDRYFIDTQAGFTWNSYESDRTITAVNEKSISAFNGQSYAAKLKAGMVHHLSEHVNITPTFTLHFIKSAIDGYQEQGANSLNLQVKAINANFLEARAGLKIGYVTKLFALPELKHIASNITLSYGQAIINDTPTTISNFEGQSANFHTTISHIDNNSLRLGAQIIGYHIDDLTFSANYTMERKQSFQSHLIALKIKHAF